MVIFETLKPAARTRIGQRGLYVSSLTRLPDGRLLACAHWGSAELQMVSIWCSTDGGRRWCQVYTQGDELFGRGALLHTLRDGAVLLHTGALYRSVDGGVTWQRLRCPHTGNTRSIVELTNGDLLMFGSDSSWYCGHEPPPRELLGVCAEWYREGSQGTMAMRSAWRIRSQDGGHTWSERQQITEEDIRIDSETDWLALQPFFRQTSIVQLSDDHLLAAARRAKPERTVLVESTDGGKHWTGGRDLLVSGEIHAHLLALNDGRLLCTYARQDLPRGIFAVLSSDRGKTWDVDHPAHLVLCFSLMIHYPEQPWHG